MTAAPAKAPCGSCPYRLDAPSGVWDAVEYDKLYGYDRPTAEQPVAAFFCHQQDGRLCAGWVGCHDMVESLGLRLAVATGLITREDQIAALRYVSAVPLFASGAAAADHGKTNLDTPGDDAIRVIVRLERKRGVMVDADVRAALLELNPHQRRWLQRFTVGPLFVGHGGDAVPRGTAGALTRRGLIRRAAATSSQAELTDLGVRVVAELKRRRVASG